MTTNINTAQGPRGIKDVLSEEELAAITEKSDLHGAIIVAFDWAVVIGLFVLAALYPNPLTYLLVVILLGGRQLAFGVIVHETGHRSLFKSAAVNNFVGNWLAGYWVFSDKEAYMRGHLKHHQDAGTPQDPDLRNYDAYPVTTESFKRKVFRDLSGQTGWRRIKSIGRSLWHIRELKEWQQKTLIRSVAVNVFLLLVLTAFGYPHLYALWVIAFMTTHMLISRIRQVAEHAACDHFDPDTRRNTRTIYINRLERLIVAPHDLNYHMEHHLMASVPIYRLRKMHNLLKEKGYYDGMEFPRGYLTLLRQVTYSAEPSTA